MCVLRLKTLTFIISEITICQHSCSGLQRITLKTENNHLANIDSCQSLESCLSTGKIIASVLCICRNPLIRELSLAIFFSCGHPVFEVFLFITKFKSALAKADLVGFLDINEELRPSRQNSMEREVCCSKRRSLVS